MKRLNRWSINKEEAQSDCPLGQELAVRSHCGRVEEAVRPVRTSWKGEFEDYQHQSMITDLVAAVPASEQSNCSVRVFGAQ